MIKLNIFSIIFYFRSFGIRTILIFLVDSTCNVYIDDSTFNVYIDIYDIYSCFCINQRWWKTTNIFPRKSRRMTQLFYDVLLLTSERNDNRRVANGNKDLSVFL